MNASESYAAEIVTALNTITPKTITDDRNSAWTRKIKESIAEIGTNHKFEVCTSSCDKKYEGEWLYDLIWYRNNKQIRLETVPLVLESEWSMDSYEIRVDFEKLLLANSPLKVMVFQNCNETSEQTFRNLEAGINEYSHGVSCIYILACYQWKSKQFEIRTFKKEIGKDAILITPSLN